MVGDTWAWTRALGEYPASEGWGLSYAFVGPAVISISASAAGDAFAVSVLAATTAAYTPGTYRWTSYVTKAGERHKVEDGICVVEANGAALTGDHRTHAEQTLAAIETEIAARLNPTVAAGGQRAIEDYSVAGRSVRKIPTPDLYRLRKKYAWEVWRERNPGKMSVSVGVTFVAP